MHERIGKYHIIRAAGSGGFGTVYEGYDVELDRNVAIKICTSDDENQLQRFRREARIVSRLKHRNVALVYDYGFDSVAGLHYLVEEFLSGVDLEKKIQERDDLPAPLRLRYLMEVAQGLLFVHDQGLIHRDLSPRNIRVLHDHSIKIMDFGLAKDSADSTLTLVGDNFGTVGYTAPEQITGMRTVDQRTDIFSFGIVAYELLTWSNPFKAESMGSFIHKIHHVEPDPLGDLWRGCPPDLAEAVHRCLRKRPEERFNSCSEILPVLKTTLRFLRDHETPSPHGTRSLTEATHAQHTQPIHEKPPAILETHAGGTEPDLAPASLWRRFLPGIVATALLFVLLTALLLTALRQERAPTTSPESPNAERGPETSSPELSPELSPKPSPAAALVLKDEGFVVLVRSAGGDDPVIVLAAELPRLDQLSHCYVVRLPPWSYGGKIRRDCDGESLVHSDRLELTLGVTYVYRILLADSTGKILAEASSLPVVAGE
jgi:serine/threonine protein kinase